MEHGLKVAAMEPEDFTVKDKAFNVEVIRSDNRNAYARISNGRIVISVPRRIRSTDAERIANELYSRVRKSVERNPDRYVKNANMLMDFSDGSEISALGKEFLIRIFDCNANSGSAIILGNELRAFVPSHFDDAAKKSEAAYQIRKALTKSLKSDVVEKVNAINSMHFNSNIIKIGITKASSRWGSCSRKKGSDSYSISLNFKLLLMDEKFLEYVIVHELAHTKQLNHSSIFWETVERVLPDYKERRKELKAFN